MLFHGTQNLLEFDPNCENALSLIVSSRGGKMVIQILRLMMMPLFLQLQMRDAAFAFQTNPPPQKTIPPPNYTFLYMQGRGKLSSLHF